METFIFLCIRFFGESLRVTYIYKNYYVLLVQLSINHLLLFSFQVDKSHFCFVPFRLFLSRMA